MQATPVGPSREMRLLESVASPEGRPVLVQESPAPVLRGSEPDGFDYACGVCRDVTIVENTVDGQVWDLAFHCFSCGGLSASPRLPPGMPLARPYVALTLGEYHISATVRCLRGVVIAGIEAVNRRARETGESSDVSTPRPPLSIGDAEALDALVTRAQVLLGDLFGDLAATYQRGRSARTPPRHRHRLMELIEGVRRSADSLRGEHPAVDVVSVTELNMALDLLERWRNDPAWAGIVRSLRNPTNFPHAAIKLAAASHLTDLGNGVGLAAEQTPGRRTPDLWIAVGARERMAIEVKAPLALQRRLEPVREHDVQEVVRKALKNAGTGPRGQLSARHPGLLLIGGFHLREADIELLKEEARALLSKTGDKRRHIAGVMVLSVGVLVENAILGPDAIVSSRETRLHGIITVRIAMNPRYKGALVIEIADRPGLQKVEGDAKEISLPPAERED